MSVVTDSPLVVVILSQLVRLPDSKSSWNTVLVADGGVGLGVGEGEAVGVGFGEVVGVGVGEDVGVGLGGVDGSEVVGNIKPKDW